MKIFLTTIMILPEHITQEKMFVLLYMLPKSFKHLDVSDHLNILLDLQDVIMWHYCCLLCLIVNATEASCNSWHFIYTINSVYCDITVCDFFHADQ